MKSTWRRCDVVLRKGGGLGQGKPACMFVGMVTGRRAEAGIGMSKREGR